MNYYKLTAVLLIIAVIGLSANLYIQRQTYDFGKFEIKETQLNQISSALEDEYSTIKICDIDKKEDACIIVARLN